jgi:rSAM/selenodomain-associated transferase 1
MVDLANQDAVAVLTRAPSSGGKSRLFAALGRDPDPALLAALLLDTIDGVRDAGATVIVTVTPAAAQDEVATLVGAGRGATAASAPAVHVAGQPEGDLGTRMRGTMAQLFTAGARAVALVGSDLPSVTAPLIREAFTLLGRDRDALVLGPASDGGYYLIAATRVPPVFDAIAWGSGDVLAQTRAAARQSSIRVHLLPPLDDVDTPDDLRRAPASSRTAAWARGGTGGTPRT